ncbi:MAG TPA: hypothetical protein PLU88_11405 [Armatimonadota bacterium]|nr:hypothetical protein [Armatimonadota bacterium]HPP75718.1 hypothetical protein [Armatimonadota bacterium]
MGIKDHLVKDAKSTVRRHERYAGRHSHYLTYNPGPGTQDETGDSDTRVVRVQLPASATNISLHGPGHFNKRGRGKVYGVQVTFQEETPEGLSTTHVRTIELPSPVVDVQLLERRPDERYKSVS